MIRSNHLNIDKLPNDPDILRLFNIVAGHGGVLRFVGGAVRDALKNVKSYDLNLATDLSPEELMEACVDAGYDTVPLGIKQNAIGVLINGKTIEVSSLFKYIDDKDGNTQVEYTDNWEEDASRRDLTINAVYADEQGNVFDYYNGIEDLEKGYVRFIGSAAQRIKEDPIRILRYFRFYSMYGLEEPNKKAIEACHEYCELLKKVPMEKIRDELLKIILTHHAPRAYRLMQNNDILSYILPDAQYIDNLEFFNTIAKGQKIKDEEVVKLFILYRPNEALAENMSVRLKLNRGQKNLLSALSNREIKFEDLLTPLGRLNLIYRYGKDFCQAFLLTSYAELMKVPDDLWKIYDEIADTAKPKFPITGKDIMNLGISDNRQIGNLIKELEKRWIEAGFSLDKEQLLAQFREVI